MILHGLLHTALYRSIAYGLILALSVTGAIPLMPQWSQVLEMAEQWGLIDPLLTPTPSDFPNALSVSRVQSAYTVGETLSNTLVVTFTVSNNLPPALTPQLAETANLTETLAALEAVEATPDPNRIENVLLVDTLDQQATYLAASPQADWNADQYAWNLGDLEPLQSMTVTLTLEVPTTVADELTLDGGARAWGTWQESVVNADACPLTLLPDTLNGEPAGPFLQVTVDANYHDEYAAWRAGQLCQAGGAFEYVRTLGYEAYYGSLRGARGAEWSQAGNSLDQANLLTALLRANGTPTRYQHGTLSTERAQELILSMFPLTGAVVGYVPEDVPVSDPVNDPDLLAEVEDHWWVEAYLDGNWVAMDPSFKYAELGQTFATPIEVPQSAVPEAMRHQVTVSIETERYHMLNYLHGGFDYKEQFTYTFSTAELVGEPLTLEHMVARQTPPMCLFFCWTRYTYVPYLRVGDSPWIIQGHSYGELLSNFPFGQTAITAEWLHFDLQKPVPSGNAESTRYTRQIADRISAGPWGGPLREPKMIKQLMSADVLSAFGPGTPALMHEVDSHTAYLSPAWMAGDYAAQQADALLQVAQTVPDVPPMMQNIEQLGVAEQHAAKRELLGFALDSIQAFNRSLGASFLAFSDAASRDLAGTALVKSYPDSPRITIASTVNQVNDQGTEIHQVQMLDLLHDNLRAIAYPGQATNAELVYRMTRGVNETFLESMVGESLTGQASASAANLLKAAQNQGIPLVRVDAEHLNVLAEAQITGQAKAFIWDAVQRGKTVLAPAQGVEWQGEQRIAWWELDPETGEMIGVGADGTHQHLVIFVAEVLFFATIVHLVLNVIRAILARFHVWRGAATVTWTYFWHRAHRLVEVVGMPAPQAYQRALADTKAYMRSTAWDQFAEGWENIPWAGWIPVEREW